MRVSAPRSMKMASPLDKGSCPISFSLDTGGLLWSAAACCRRVFPIGDRPS